MDMNLDEQNTGAEQSDPNHIPQIGIRLKPEESARLIALANGRKPNVVAKELFLRALGGSPSPQSEPRADDGLALATIQDQLKSATKAIEQLAAIELPKPDMAPVLGLIKVNEELLKEIGAKATAIDLTPIIEAQAKLTETVQKIAQQNDQTIKALSAKPTPVNLAPLTEAQAKLAADVGEIVQISNKIAHQNEHALEQLAHLGQVEKAPSIDQTALTAQLNAIASSINALASRPAPNAPAINLKPILDALDAQSKAQTKRNRLQFRAGIGAVVLISIISALNFATRPSTKSIEERLAAVEATVSKSSTTSEKRLTVLEETFLKFIDHWKKSKPVSQNTEPKKP